MKLKLLLFLLLILVPRLHSQNVKKDSVLPLYNLYYLSRYIVADELKPYQNDQVYNSLKSAIAYDNKNIADNIPITVLEKYKMVNAFLKKDIFKRSQLKIQITNEFMAGVFQTQYLQKDEGIELRKKYDEEIKNNNQAIIKDQIKYLEILKKALVDNDTLQNSFATNKLAQLNIPEDKIKIQIDVDSMLKKIVEKDTTYEINKAAYAVKVDAYTNKLIQDKNIVSNFKVTNFETPTNFTATTTEIYLNSIMQSAEQRAISTSFNLPSESDLIKAMAIFLAKRAQQETAIWFMDQLRKNLKNALIYEAFPETIKLIENLEDFKTPSFNVAWRYAISSDFVMMPKNLANSNYVQNLMLDNDQDKITLLTTGINFGYDLNRLISEKYNYRDIIRYFYTNTNFEPYNNSTSNLTNNNAQQSIRTAITILYILTNEFYAVDIIDNKPCYRLLSYEEISSLSNSQWFALGELIQIKYGTKFPADSTFFSDDFPKQAEISKWMGNLLIILSQFDKVNKEYQKALESKNDITSFNFYNVWQITSQIIDNLDYHKYLPKSSSIDTFKFDITLVKDCMKVYNDIQNKNFDAGIKKTLEIIEKVSAFSINYNVNEFNLGNMLVRNTASGLTFSINGNTYKLKYSQSDLQILENESNKAEVTMLNYSKVQPFLRFVNNTDDDDENYKVIKSLNPNFDIYLEDFMQITGEEKLVLIELLKIHNLIYNKSNKKYNILDFLKTSKYINQTNLAAHNAVEDNKSDSEKKLFKMTAFFGDVLGAKDENELANVIDSHALPPTSYKLKRRVAHSIDLNAYVGAQLSGLFTNGDTSMTDQFTAGITAPIGFAFSWTTSGPKHNNWGFTIDVIDLGNIVNHYLISSTPDYEPDVHFSEIFSPAISGMYSIKNTPFVIFGSVKFLPLKTTLVEEKLINNKTFDATIFSAGIKIDIPLVNLFTRIDYK